MSGSRSFLTALVTGIALTVAGPTAAENVLRWGTGTPAETFDPYGHDILATFWVQRQVYEPLVDYDWQGQLGRGSP